MSGTYVAPPNWQPPPPRPPLTPREKSGARLAGILGFLLLSVGFGLFSIPIVVIALGAFFALVVEFFRRISRNDQGFEQFLSAFESLNPTAWILPLILAAVVGLALMAGALLLSARILRSHDVERPWAVTWAGTGVAIIASWFLSGLSAIPFSFTGAFRGDDVEGSIGIGIALAVLSFLIGLAASAVVGWLSWWWMAHAFRRSPTAITAA